MDQFNQIIVDQWYYPRPWGKLLWPFAKVFGSIVKLRKYLYVHNVFKSYKASVPVIIVGNLTVGGTGKTPLVIYLAELLKKHGYKPGIVSRGYKGLVKSVVLVSPYSDPQVVSDEAVLLSRRTECPVIIAKKRAVGVDHMIRHNRVNIIICDDGLQHYALQRDIEIAVIDGERRFGNGYNLPMGPMREPESRLDTVDLIVTNSSISNNAKEHNMHFVCNEVYSLSHPNKNRSLEEFIGRPVHAIAGIGYPERFFQQLRDLGIIVIAHPYPDHYRFSPTDVTFADQLPVLMTEKDAVKCKYFAHTRLWVVKVSVELEPQFDNSVLRLIEEVKNARQKST
jgi:tetraacyldisaccharide 4'-kinase